MNPINLITTIVNAAFSVFNGRQVVQAQSNNAYTTGYTINNILMTTPYGMYALPNDNTNATLIPINGSPKALQCIGFTQSLPADSPITLAQGEFTYASNNWSLNWNNDGLRANKLDNADYLATLISGEWANKIMSNLINDNNSVLRNYINNTINAFLTSHVHSPGTFTAGGDPVLGVSGAATTSVTNIATSTTLSDDANYISNENDLLNDNAIPVP